jgi:hypothetical protein
MERTPTNQAPSSSPQHWQIGFARPWHVLRPRIYRYMENKYIDDFFRDGSLRLSSFKKFAEHPDENLRDSCEGKGIQFLTGKDCTVFLVKKSGENCYVFCCSVLNTNLIFDEFEHDFGCLRIDNSIAFADAISCHIPGFSSGAEGLAIYQDNASIVRHNESLSINDIDMPHDKSGALNERTLSKLGAMMGGIEEHFLKQSKHAYQSEYRIIWQSTQDIGDFIDIKVPEARQFCKREFRPDA